MFLTKKLQNFLKLVISTSKTEPYRQNMGKYVSKEERIFQRQLESAIETSRMRAIELAPLGLSQKQGKNN